MTPNTLQHHLANWLGRWPPADTLQIVESNLRAQPGWDGKVRPLAGVSSPAGAVLSVPPGMGKVVSAAGSTLDEIAPRIGPLLGLPGKRLGAGVFRWTTQPSGTPDHGIWRPPDDPDLPPWLRPFNGDVLVGFEGGRVTAGVGRKLHDPFGHELAVVTEPAFRGRGWARALVAQAARRVLSDGAIPMYLHDPANRASARTADAAGFPDLGWRVLGLW